MTEGGTSVDGVTILESVYLTEDETQVIKRAWRERLFSWPWRPFQSTRNVVVKVPLSGAVWLSEKTLVMHPETLRNLRASLNRGEKSA